MSSRPSSIDTFLTGKPGTRRELVELAADPCVTVDQLLNRIHALGCTASRSADHRWMIRHRQAGAGPQPTLKEAIIAKVLVVERKTLARVAKVLSLA